MTPEQLETLVQEIIGNLELGADIASIFRPEIIPFVVMGKALDKAIPGLAGTVQKWIDGNPPTDDERAELKAKLAILADPDNP
jgi:hypothetical protein